jgi:putative ATPase
VSPLLSRSLLLTLEPLTDDDLRAVLVRALADERGLGAAVALAPDAADHLVRLAGGDARRVLTYLEAAAGSAQALGLAEIDLATAEAAVDTAAVRYDRAGDAHYDVTSAFIKSLRGSAADAVQRIGMPEAQLNLGQAVIHLATAPKSNTVTTAVFGAIADVRKGRGGAVPPGLRDAHYACAERLGHGTTYQYPHNDPNGVVRQQYAPDELVGVDYYRPGRHGAERPLAERVERLRRIVRGDAATADRDGE